MEAKPTKEKRTTTTKDVFESYEDKKNQSIFFEHSEQKGVGCQVGEKNKIKGGARAPRSGGPQKSKLMRSPVCKPGEVVGVFARGGSAARGRKTTNEK
jgi:hypothetical protein